MAAMSSRLLVLGGTAFLGRHVVEAALRRGHAVTVFNRGRRSVSWPGPVEALVGDRNADVSSLRGRRFDAVIDCSGYTPEQARRATEALGAQPPHWIYISSISVCAGFAPHVQYDESAAVTTDADGYGGHKARSEEVLAAITGGRLAIVRPGLIVGPFDPTGRFAHWPARVDRGGDLLLPGRPERPVQVIDARDLADWCLLLAQRQMTGTFHAIGPMGPMASLVDACVQASREAGGLPARLHWWPDAAVQAAGLEAWTELPLWVPEDDPDAGGIFLGRNDRAVAAGLVTRPWIDTVRDTLAWLHREPNAKAFGAGLSAEREAALLAAGAPS
jgi:2'-hydroxyisoflavone reductase